MAVEKACRHPIVAIGENCRLYHDFFAWDAPNRMPAPVEIADLRPRSQRAGGHHVASRQTSTASFNAGAAWTAAPPACRAPCAQLRQLGNSTKRCRELKNGLLRGKSSKGITGRAACYSPHGSSLSLAPYSHRIEPAACLILGAPLFLRLGQGPVRFPSTFTGNRTALPGV